MTRNIQEGDALNKTRFGLIARRDKHLFGKIKCVKIRHRSKKRGGYFVSMTILGILLKLYRNFSHDLTEKTYPIDVLF